MEKLILKIVAKQEKKEDKPQLNEVIQHYKKNGCMRVTIHTCI